MALFNNWKKDSQGKSKFAGGKSNKELNNEISYHLSKTKGGTKEQRQYHGKQYNKKMYAKSLNTLHSLNKEIARTFSTPQKNELIKQRKQAKAKSEKYFRNI